MKKIITQDKIDGLVCMNPLSTRILRVPPVFSDSDQNYGDNENGRILIADDQMFNIDALKIILEHFIDIDP